MQIAGVLCYYEPTPGKGPLGGEKRLNPGGGESLCEIRTAAALDKSTGGAAARFLYCERSESASVASAAFGGGSRHAAAGRRG